MQLGSVSRGGYFGRSTNNSQLKRWLITALKATSQDGISGVLNNLESRMSSMSEVSTFLDSVKLPESSGLSSLSTKLSMLKEMAAQAADEDAPDFESKGVSSGSRSLDTQAGRQVRHAIEGMRSSVSGRLEGRGMHVMSADESESFVRLEEVFKQALKRVRPDSIVSRYREMSSRQNMVNRLSGVEPDSDDEPEDISRQFERANMTLQETQQRYFEFREGFMARVYDQIEFRDLSLQETQALEAVTREVPRLFQRARGSEVLSIGRMSQTLEEAVRQVEGAEDDSGDVRDMGVSVPERGMIHVTDEADVSEFKGVVIHELVHHVVHKNPDFFQGVERSYKYLNLGHSRDVKRRKNEDLRQRLSEGEALGDRRLREIEDRIAINDGFIKRINDLGIESEPFVSDYASMDSEEFLCEVMREYYSGTIDPVLQPRQFALAEHFDRLL